MSAIREFVQAEPLFDNHEHQNGFSAIEGQKKDLDFRAFGGYLTADLATAAGRAPGKGQDAEFWEAWQFARTTGYGQATQLACRAMLEMDFSAENAGAITAALRDYAAPRSGRQIYEELFALANVRWAVCDECWDSPTKLAFFSGQEHPDFFGHALRYDAVIGLSHRDQVAGFERAMDCTIQRLSDLDAALDAYTDRARQGGKLVAMKSAMAYLCPLRFEHSSYADAERAFEQLMQGRPADTEPLRGYLFHRFVQRAREFALPVQIHTGYLAGNWGSPAQGDPTGLIPIFQRYRGVQFDLFHAGWPYSELMGAIGKSFPNVHLDLCWAWSMNPAAMERTLEEWLSAVPHNKIFGFGGDTGAPYPAVGYALQARQGIANVLERMVDRGQYDLPTAQQVARRIMHENARALYAMG